MGEDNSKWSNWERMNLKNIQATPAAQFQKNKRPNQKTGQRTKQTFLQRRHQMANKHMKRAHHHSWSEKCKSKPQWGIISHWFEWPSSKSLQTINAGEGVEKMELSYTIAYWECKLIQPLWTTVWRFPKKLGIELQYSPVIPLLGIHTEETGIERDTCTPMFIAALFIIARMWKQPRCPTADEW